MANVPYTPKEAEPPLIASLLECSEWLSRQGIQRTAKKILEDAAEGLITLYSPVVENGFIPEKIVVPTPERIRAMHAALGKDPSKVKSYGIRNRKAEKGELIRVGKKDCLQFLAAGETSVNGTGFTDDAELIEGTMRAIIILSIDAFRVKREDLGTYAARQERAHPPKPEPSKTTENRQARRYQMCLDAGLTMPTDDYAHLPRGIGALARQEGITRQAFSEDVKAHIRRLNGR
ncbi:MAG: hypothetical protein AB3X41_02125 [Leptothrix ochracea]|uniref:hypothetical protein n=1 Tax=Leptothrix ochracea TaxID=735331 RepID=UPI0034E2DD08